MSPLRIRDTLVRIFDVVVREADRNPTLARELAQAIAGDLGAAAAAGKPSGRKPFDATRFHAVNILRQHGEAALRGKLEEVKAADDLKSVARASGLVLTGDALKGRPSRAQLISAIVDAAKHYDAQRAAATA
jgi:hypothetical protein